MKQYLSLFLGSIILFACQQTMQRNKTASAHHHVQATDAMSNTTIGYADSVNAGLIAADTLKGSPLRMSMANIGTAHVHIEYSSPGMKNRIIWGGLVPYDKVWVSGAHAATSIDFSRDVIIMGKPVKAGTYAFFTMPGKEKWIAILNTRYDQHLTDEYDPAEDVARFALTPEVLDHSLQRLTYYIEPVTDTSGIISLAWEKIKISLPVTAKSKRS